eukprot:Phypoly_transcript_00465.p1 GENE.Phypoly_transcript_00465~~Phypoly_transcript_00465.p1  ORF type:complete len:1411 (+),score=128.73 Phypoly_transcript_00465:182-4414(+)
MRLWQILTVPKIPAIVYTRLQKTQIVLSLTALGLFLLILMSRFITGEYHWFQVLSDILYALSWGFCTVLIIQEFSRGAAHNWVVRSWWVLQFVSSSLVLQTIADGQLESPRPDAVLTGIVALVYVVLAVVGLWLNRASDQYKPLSADDSTPEEIEMQHTDKIILDDDRCPYEYSNYLSRATFWWANKMLAIGNKRPLNAGDLWPLCTTERANYLCEKFDDIWTEEAAKPHHENALRKTMIRVFWRMFALSGIFKLFNDVCQFMQPVMLNLVISFVQDREAPYHRGFLIVLAMFSLAVTQTLSVNTYFFGTFRVGMQVRSAVVSIVYRKSVRLSNSARMTTSVGEIVNHQSIDAQRFQNLLPYLHMAWSAPFQIAIAMYMLWKLVGVAVLGGVAVMILVIPLNTLMARKQGAIQKKMLVNKDQRIKATNEVLSGIRVIKFFAWEDSFLAKIGVARGLELKTLRQSVYFRAFTMFIFSSTPLFVAATSFAIFVLRGGDLTAEIAFPAIALFSILRFPMNMLPNVISGLIEARVSLIRVQKFLLNDEIDPNAVEHKNEAGLAIKIHNGDFRWAVEGTPTLQEINMTVPQGQLVAVVGSVGSGKSSLISAILGEITKLNGKVTVNGTVAYVPQQSWMQNATLKENVLFGKTYSEHFYYQCLTACELTADLAVLPSGDLTEIGEKGINLSGGQKQRVSCARAMYQNADIYLLDAPLSAVDAHVGNAMFHNLILEALKGKTRILVCHQLHVLPYVDQVIVLDNGHIVEQGTYTELLAKGGELEKLVRTHGNKVDESEMGEGESSTAEDSKLTKDKNKNENDEKPTTTKLANSKIIAVEERAVGSVSWHVYKKYFKAVGGYSLVALIVFFYFLESMSKVAADWWLSYWTSQTSKIVEHRYLAIYVLFGVGGIVVTLSRALLLAYGGLRSAKTLHDDMLYKVAHAPVQFFDTTPLGRVVNRFSKDQYTIDETLPMALGSFLATGMGVFGVMSVIVSITPFFLVGLLPLAYLYYYVQQYYLSCSRELQRLDSTTKSPIFAQFSETLNGITTIRSFGVTDNFIRENDRKLDLNTQAYFASVTTNRWLSVRLEFICTCVVSVAALFCVIERDNIDAGLAGLSLTYALSLTGILNWLVRQSSEVETQIVSVERVNEYTELVEEGPYLINGSLLPPQWPSQGMVEFDDVELRYRVGLDPVLKGVSFTIHPHEKVGIIGRTGAGKSSLIQALFRMVEAERGKILIDGINIRTIGLKDLRSKLAIIPQDPTLFTGTIRSNLDPFNQYEDQAVWQALEACYMKTAVEQMEKKLEAPVSENGENLSVGQRQLMCLGRALLRNVNILVMDEATAAVDLETDSLIQKTIREQFHNRTVLTIAHRLNTIIDNDKILVMDQGKVAEYDSPDNLRQNTASIFYSLLKESGLA